MDIALKINAFSKSMKVSLRLNVSAKFVIFQLHAGAYKEVGE